LGQSNQRARQINTETNIEVSVLPPISITDADAVSLLMNLLNNALESCEKIQPPDKRWIEVERLRRVLNIVSWCIESKLVIVDRILGFW